jgi:hypothetical protein
VSTPTTTFPCPVCLREAHDERRCPTCDWVLSTEYTLGHVTDAEQADFDRGLAHAQQSHDLRAALLAAGHPRVDDPLLDRLVRLVRGGTVTPAAIEEARSALATPAQGDKSLVPAVVDAMRRLMDVPGGAVIVVELTADGVTWTRFDRTDMSFAATRTHTAGWRSALPSLPAKPAPQRFALAGGVGADPTPHETTAREIAAFVRRAGFADGAEIVVATHLSGWAIPTRLVATLQDDLDAHTTEIALSGRKNRLTDQTVAEVLDGAPLCQDIAVVLADTDLAGGPVRLRLRTIFPAGASVATARAEHVRVAAPSIARTPMPVVVATGDGTDPARWRAHAVSRVGVRPGEEHVLQFGLGRGGAVQVTCGPDDAVDPTPAERVRDDWTAIAAAVPRTYEPAEAGPADIVFAVELGGEPADVERRVRLVTDVVRHVEDSHPTPKSVQYSVIAYRDHSNTRTSHADVLDICPLGSVTQCLTFVRGLRAEMVVYQHAAPLEDALFAAERQWRRARERRSDISKVVVILGARTPHLIQDAKEPRCPGRHSWRESLSRLKEDGSLVVAVWDEPPSAGERHSNRRAATTRRTWHEIGALPPYALARWTGADVVRRIAVLDPPPTEQPLVLPINPTGGTP